MARFSGLGPTGPAGADSTAEGPTGPTGPTGADSSIEGPTGPTGPQGEAGPTGPAADATIVNTDGDPGRTIYVGSIDPNISYTLQDGDIWIETA
jgi:hypothetical protein